MCLVTKGELEANTRDVIDAHTHIFFKYTCLACSSMNPHYSQFGIDNLHTLKNTNVERLTFCQHSVGTVQL